MSSSLIETKLSLESIKSESEKSFQSESVASESIASDSQGYSSDFEKTESQENLDSVIRKQVEFLKRKQSTQPKHTYKHTSSQNFDKQMSLLKNPPRKKAYLEKIPVDKNLVEKVAFQNKLNKLLEESKPDELENQALIEKVQAIEQQKFIQTQFIRLQNKRFNSVYYK